MLKQVNYAFLGGAVLLLPALMALWLTHDARQKIYFGDPIHYSQHQLPKGDTENILQRLGYQADTDQTRQRDVPRVFLSRLPENMPDIKSVTQRKQLFSAILLPLILRVNELILDERERLITLKTRVENGGRLGALEQHWLSQLAEKYRVLVSGAIDDAEFTALVERVNIIPPSLAMAQAAIESGWGTSRFAQKGNALYGQWVWGDDDDGGIVPLGREEGKRHKIKAFDYLIHSVEGYAANLNRHPAYENFRRARGMALGQDAPISGRLLAETMIDYSARREEYVAELQSIIRANQWSWLDGTELETPTYFNSVQDIANVVPAAGGAAPGE